MGVTVRRIRGDEAREVFRQVDSWDRIIRSAREKRDEARFEVDEFVTFLYEERQRREAVIRQPGEDRETWDTYGMMTKVQYAGFCTVDAAWAVFILRCGRYS